MPFEALHNLADIIIKQQRLRDLGKICCFKLLSIFSVKIPALTKGLLPGHQYIETLAHFAIERLHAVVLARINVLAYLLLR